MKVLDSIWRNYYVPPVVFAIFKDEDGEEVKRCVDGKQRLTSIQKFIDGQVSNIESSTSVNHCPSIKFHSDRYHVSDPPVAHAMNLTDFRQALEDRQELVVHDLQCSEEGPSGGAKEVENGLR